MRQLSWHSILILNLYFKGDKIKKEDIKLKMWRKGIEKSLNCAKKAFIFLICAVFTQLSGLFGSLWKCFTAFLFYFESFSELSDLEENFEKYEESMTTLLYSKKLYFPDSISRKVYWSEEMCKRKILRKPTKTCIKPKNSQTKDIILNDEMKSKILFSIKSIEAKLAASNTVMQILKTEKCMQLKSLDQLLSQYTGRGEKQ